MHGIRTYGDWQSDLKHLLEAVEPGVTVLNYQYGYFSSLAFLVPPLRWLVARRFRKFFAQALASVPNGSRIDLVAHSFGTYLAASAVPYVPRDRGLHTVILAGSVLRPSFPWYRYQQAGFLGRVVNECGWDDSVLLLCQFSKHHGFIFAVWVGLKVVSPRNELDPSPNAVICAVDGWFRVG